MKSWLETETRPALAIAPARLSGGDPIHHVIARLCQISWLIQRRRMNAQDLAGIMEISYKSAHRHIDLLRRLGHDIRAGRIGNSYYYYYATPPLSLADPKRPMPI